MRKTSDSVLAVGFFDGVHLGHQAILRGADAALTFRDHPLSVLAPGKAPPLVMSCEERVAAILACGPREAIVLDFTPELAALDPEEFVERISSRHPFKAIRCGANWRFGRGGAGDAEWLRRRGYGVEVVPYEVCRGAPVSSSRLRECLAAGRLEDFREMAGRELSVAARRFAGKGLGREIGYPTVNCKVDSPAAGILPRGVYEVSMGGARGIANFGVAPTMGASAWTEPVVEVHFPGGDVPPEQDGESISFRRFIRPERRFESLAALKAQIAMDCGRLDV